MRDFVVTRDLAGTAHDRGRAAGGAVELTRVALRPRVPLARATALFGVAPELGAPVTLAALDPAVLDLPLPRPTS